MGIYHTEGENDGAWHADKVVEEYAQRIAQDEIGDIATMAGHHGRQPEPELTEEMELYAETYAKGFAAEFMRLYPAACREAYKHAYMKAYNEALTEHADAA